MSNVLVKVKSMLGLGEYDEDYDDDFEENEEYDEMEDEAIEPVIQNKRNNKVVNIHSNASAKVSIVRPSAYDEATDICDAVKNRRIVVINTSALENKLAQRLLDFVSGACYALGGELQEIDKGVYLLSPSNVEVTSELRSEISNKAIFNWNK